MNSIEQMKLEHQYILRMLTVVRSACMDIMEGKEPVFEDFDQMIDFIKNYADVHHHGKEEQFLFEAMKQHLGVVGQNLVLHGMMVEHDLGRLYIHELKEAIQRVKDGDTESRLDIIANAIGYTNHLTRHIAKEDTAVYIFAEQRLPKEVLVKVNEDSARFEEEALEKGIQNRYISVLFSLEQKYLQK